MSRVARLVSHRYRTGRRCSVTGVVNGEGGSSTATAITYYRGSGGNGGDREGHRRSITVSWRWGCICVGKYVHKE